MTSFPFSSKLIPNILLLSASITYSRLCANTQAHALQTFTSAIRTYHVTTWKRKKKKYSHILKKKKKKNPSSLRFENNWLSRIESGSSKNISARHAVVSLKAITRVGMQTEDVSLSWLPFPSRNWYDIHIYAICRGQYTYPWTDKQRAHSRLCTSSSLPFSSWIRSRARGRQ